MSEASKSRRAREVRPAGLDTPLESKPRWYRRYRPNPEAFGVVSEGIARWMGTPQFLVWMTVFVAVWLGWNTFMPENLQFDPRALNYTLLTLMLSLQASYAAPLLLLADNRQADRDRVQAEQDRQRAEQNLADTEYLTREIASLRIVLREVATRDFVRSELRDLLEELTEDEEDAEESGGDRPGRRKRVKSNPETKTSILDLAQADETGPGTSLGAAGEPGRSRGAGS